jgi:DNA ligase-1
MTSLVKRPMLAGKVEDVSKLPFPMIASPKLDGIRALTIGGRLMSRSLKPIPNRYIQAQLAHLPEGLDGELMSGQTFQQCTSAVMAHDGEPTFEYWCFDYIGSDRFGSMLGGTYDARLAVLRTTVTRIADARVHALPTVHIPNEQALARYEADCIAMGFEGVMLRRPEGPYKEGRSTWREGYLLKLKRFEDSEAIVIDFEEQMHNTNEAQTNELGRTKRSSAKDGLVPKGTLGALRVRLLTPGDNGTLVVAGTRAGVEFNIGTGMDDALRAEIWANRDSYVGRIVKFKHQPYGAKDAPRLPVFQGFRDARDT